MTERTAWDLLARVARYILEEPRRYYQGVWMLRHESVIRSLLQYQPPVCGTVACCAGWVVALHDWPDCYARVMELSIRQRADEILGLEPLDTDPLFDQDAIAPHLRPGTHAYARAGAQNIRKFMKRHEAHLKARVLPKAHHT